MSVKFLCDQMLGTLAKWLRILGFDVYFADRVENDDEILERAKMERRIILTRDKQLVIRAKKRNIDVVEINERDLNRQLKSVISVFPLRDEDILSRCSICNTPLVKIDKESIKGKVPDKVYKSHSEFWYCKNCGRIYWRGSHWENIRERVNVLKRNISR